MNLDWIIGFLEGEGCFTSFTRRQKGKLIKCPKFSLYQNDRKILEMVRDYLMMGTITKGSPSHKNICYSLNISAYLEVEKLIKLIKGRLQMDKKKEQFKQWERLFSVCEVNRYSPGYRWWEIEKIKKLYLENKTLVEISKAIGRIHKASGGLTRVVQRLFDEDTRSKHNRKVNSIKQRERYTRNRKLNWDGESYIPNPPFLTW